MALSVEIDKIREILRNLRSAPGRMELFSSDIQSNTQVRLPSVIVDYAHTPDALNKALSSIKQHCSGKLWCVFGCGGDRDVEKRPVMGEVASRLADRVIVTSDNPRSESVEQIAKQIKSGMNLSSAKVDTLLDRREAISYSISNAKSEDWVLVAGKGHELTQAIGEEILAFSDREHVVRCLRATA